MGTLRTISKGSIACFPLPRGAAMVVGVVEVVVMGISVFSGVWSGNTALFGIVVVAGLLPSWFTAANGGRRALLFSFSDCSGVDGCAYVACASFTSWVNSRRRLFKNLFSPMCSPNFNDMSVRMAELSVTTCNSCDEAVLDISRKCSSSS